MRRLFMVLLLALGVTAAAVPDALAARWLAGGGTGASRPSSGWQTSTFAAPVGRVDIYTVCSSHGAASHTVFVRRAGSPSSVSQAYTLPCDGQPRWLRRMGIPISPRLEVRAVAKKSNGIPCSLSDGIIRCATGYTSVWSSGW
jgi:hypothetical protein